jgi:hypothetical protein
LSHPKWAVPRPDITATVLKNWCKKYILREACTHIYTSEILAALTFREMNERAKKWATETLTSDNSDVAGFSRRDLPVDGGNRRGRRKVPKDCLKPVVGVANGDGDVQPLRNIQQGMQNSPQPKDVEDDLRRQQEQEKNNSPPPMNQGDVLANQASTRPDAPKYVAEVGETMPELGEVESEFDICLHWVSVMRL